MPANDPIIYRVSADNLRTEPLVGSANIKTALGITEGGLSAGTPSSLSIFDANGNVTSSNLQFTQSALVLPDASRYSRGEYTGVLTLHVSNSGNDTTGDGSVSAPYATIQRAFTECGKVSFATSITIQLADGTYSAATLNIGPKIVVNLQGNSSDPKLVYINGLLTCTNSRLQIRNLLVRTIWSVQCGRIEVRENIIFGDATANGNMEAFENASIYLYNNYRVSCSVAGTTNRHIGLAENSLFVVAGVVTCSMEGVGGKFAWETIYGRQGSHFRMHNYTARMHYVVTGSQPAAERYQLDFLSSMDTLGGGATYIPGTNAGSLIQGSVYN